MVGRCGPVCRAALLTGAAVAFLAVGCRGGDRTPRIVYPYPSVSGALVRVAQPAIDAWRRPRIAELPESLMRYASRGAGYPGDVAYAEAMVSVPGLVAAVAPQSSRASLLVAPVYAEHGIPLICATGTSDQLGALGPWVFQLAPDNAAEGAFMAHFVLDRLAARRVAIFYLDADEYGLSLRDGAVRALEQRGVTPVDQVGIIAESDLPRRVAESLKRAIPDAVMVAARSPEAVAVTRAVHARLPRVPVVLGDGVPLNESVIHEAGASAGAMYAAAWWSPDRRDTLSRAFVARFQQANHRLPSAAEAMYYDAIMVAAAGVRDAGPQRDLVRRYLSELGTVRPPFPGVTGPISFAPQRRINLLMTHVENGAVVVVNGPEAGP